MKAETRQKPGLGTRIRGRAERWLRHRRFMRSISHLHGPRRINAQPTDVTVVALVRDGMFYLEEFLKYYRDLGAHSFVFFDTGSTDGTVERLKQETDVSILQSPLPWGEFESDFRNYAATELCMGHWVLYADMDELFCFEGQDQIGLTGLTRYLQTEGYTGLVAQMLEMVPDEPLAQAATWPYSDVLERFTFYDVTDVIDRDYFQPEAKFGWFLRDNTLGSDQIRVKMGGLRHKFFGEMCCLTKHPLVFVDGHTQPGVHPHCASNVRTADFTALIKHYKFANDTLSRDRESVATQAIHHGEDALRLKRMSEDSALSLRSDSAQAFAGVGPLQQQGFLVASQRFRDFIARFDT